MSDLSPVLSLLVNLFVLSVILESAYTTLFSWRIYMIYLGGKGYKVPIMVTLNIVLLSVFGYDFFEQLFEIIKGTSGSLADPIITSTNLETKDLIGYFFSALLLAGGSKAILEILNKLKIRNSAEADHKQHVLQLEHANKKIKSSKTPHLVFDKAAKTLTGLGKTWSANSGTTSGFSEITNGTYICPPRSLMIGTEDDSTVPRDQKYAAAPYLDKNEYGWFLWLGTNNLGVHPDGNVPGTEGCIGITDGNTRPLFDSLKAKYLDEIVVLVK